VSNARGVLTAGAAVAGVVLLAACSSGGSQAGYATLPSSSTNQSRAAADVLRSGVTPRFASLMVRGVVTRRVSPDRGKADLFVDDFNNNAVAILKNKSFGNAGTITAGIDEPDGNWFDKHGLYVANYVGINIGQYKSPTSETFTYSAGMTDPVDVTTDSQGNVYEADYDYPYFFGAVREYAQKSNTVIASCSPGGGVEGVAVDANGDVFVGFNQSSQTQAYIVEYAGGLSDCAGTVLPLTFSFLGGMVFDKHDNLIVCDQNAPAIDVIAPPYTSVTKTFGSGYTDPFHITLDKKNNLAYVVDLGTATVDVLKYPSGASVATLGSANGLSLPSGAVDASNFAP
jgi:hypothetical protein